MTCTKCGCPMTGGAPHVDYPAVQWECRCGNVVAIATDDAVSERLALNAAWNSAHNPLRKTGDGWTTAGNSEGI